MTDWIYKTLRLVSARDAHQRGLAAEGPVFISPVIHGAYTCPGCAAVYSPLVYSVGRATATQHRSRLCDGIWHYHNPPPVAEWPNGIDVVATAVRTCNAWFPPGISAWPCGWSRVFTPLVITVFCSHCHRPITADGVVYLTMAMGLAVCADCRDLRGAAWGERLVALVAAAFDAGDAKVESYAVRMQDGVPHFTDAAAALPRTVLSWLGVVIGEEERSDPV